MPRNEAVRRMAAQITATFAKACKTHKTGSIPEHQQNGTANKGINGVGKHEHEEEEEEEAWVDTDQDLFPCLVVCYGSGATFNLVRINRSLPCHEFDLYLF